MSWREKPLLLPTAFADRQGAADGMLVAPIFAPPAKIARMLTEQGIPAPGVPEWLPALQDYEFAAGYCVEIYDAPNKYPNGTNDENYYTEI